MSTADKIATVLKLTSYDFDPGATTETEIAWVDMTDFTGLLVQFFRTIGTGAVTLRIMANTTATGSGTDVAIITKTVSAEPDAVGDYIFLETDSQAIAAAAAAAGVSGVRYVTAVVSSATATDEGVVTYVRTAMRPQDGLTADLVA